MTELLCQHDAYLTELTTEVLSCQPAGELYEVVPAATLLYPEGGGQPDDHGTLAGQPVLGLRKEPDGDVVHLVAQPAQGQVQIRLDWPRRFDHMQQHTAQHLLTALAQDRLGWATRAFHLGPERADIELDVAGIGAGQLEQLERAANQLILDDLPVTVEWLEPRELEQLKDRVRSRGLPEGLRQGGGPVRLVTIEGLDRNTCGGTHVARTAELQVIKLAGTEKMRGGTRLYYLAGERVLRRLGQSLERERALSGRLSCGPADHDEAVERLQQELRQLRRDARGLLTELAGHLGRELARRPGPVAVLHRDEAEMELLRGVIRAADEELKRGIGRPRWLLVTGGAREGLFVLGGPADELAVVGPQVAEVLEGKGGGSGTLFQGKAARLDRRDRAVELLERRVSGEPDPE